MFKKLKAAKRRAKVKKVIRDHAKEIVVGAAMGLATEALSQAVKKKLPEKLAKRLR